MGAPQTAPVPYVVTLWCPRCKQRRDLATEPPRCRCPRLVELCDGDRYRTDPRLAPARAGTQVVVVSGVMP